MTQTARLYYKTQIFLWSDFGCGPGSLVIRISGFEEDNDACVGQIIEPQTNGMLKVTWSNGKTSLCYPQDLFLCGEGELNSIFGDDTGKAIRWNFLTAII